MNSISVSYGKAVFPRSSITITAFVVEAPFLRVLASKKLTGGFYRNFTPAGRISTDGGFTDQNLQATDGTILCMQVQRKQEGKSIADSAVFLRVREKGPMLSVDAHLPTYHGSRLGSKLSVFSGRADIVTLSDLASVGIEPSDNFVRVFMDEEEGAECFEIVTIHPEIEKAPRFEIIQSESGEVVAIQADTRTRRMRVRR